MYRFGRVEVDDTSFTIRIDGSLLHVQRRVFDFIVYLLEHRDRVVRREELPKAVWAGSIVSDAAIDRCASAARRVLGDRDAIRTVHGRGYQWVALLAEAPNAKTAP